MNRRREYYLKNKSRENKKSKEYYQKNKDKIRLIEKEYRENNRLKYKQLRDKNYDKYQIARNKWIKNNKTRYLSYKNNNNLKRNELGYLKLNDKFNGSIGHHIDKDTVIYIPKEMHEKNPHNIWTGWNMDKINKLAWEYLDKKQ